MKTTTSTFKVEFLTRNCEKIYKSKEHVTLGMSPFTSKYNRAYINNLITWANYTFKRMTILLAGKESTHILECLGIPKNKAKRKVRKELNRQRRFCEEALKTIANNSCNIYTFSDFEEDKNYKNLYEDVYFHYVNDLNFKNQCLRMSKQALSSKAKNLNLPIDNITNSDLEYASKYVIAELPFFLNSNLMFNTKQTVLAYHSRWELGERINNGDFNISIDNNQGFIILKDMGGIHYENKE